MAASYPPAVARHKEATMAVAAYARIASDLRKMITSRDIKPGEQLPSELELRDQYKASRNTVLDAIKKLKDEGLVETRPGQGWFARVRIVPFVNSLDWGDAAAIKQANDSGRTPRVTPPTVSLQAAESDMAERLNVPVGTALIVRRQEWFLDDVPWRLQEVWCPRALFDQGAHRLLMAEDISQGLGVYLHETLGLRPATATFFFLPRSPRDEESKFFGFPAEGEIPYIIELIRTASTLDDSGPRPLYTVVGAYAGDRNRFEGSKLALPAG
jgi:GntR family transcriptional regulator